MIIRFAQSTASLGEEREKLRPISTKRLSFNAVRSMDSAGVSGKSGDSVVTSWE